MLQRLLGYYRKSNGETKKKILSCIFSKRIHFTDGKAAAPEYTPAIQLLNRITNVFENSKKNKEVKKDLLNEFAPPVGLEPTTL